MSENLSTEDDAQLSRWAFGRASTPEEQRRAELAAAELHRRAVVDRERSDFARESEPLAAGTGEQVDESTGEDAAQPLTDAELRKQRRMRLTGIVGVISAVFALGAVTQVQRQIDSDPLAIFDRPATQLDQEWADRMSQNPALVVTAGPRVIDLEGDLDVIAARISTVPDGRSTQWDAYCLYFGLVSAGGGWSLTADCTYPARFEEVGLSSTISASVEGEGFENVVWGPVGPPRVESNVPDHVAEEKLDLIEWMMQPNYIAEARANPLENVDEPGRLLVGPKRANDVKVIAGDELAVEVFLLAGVDDRSEPDFCIFAQHAAAEPSTACTEWSMVQRDGFGLLLQIAGEPWLVSVSDNGTILADRVNGSVTGREG